MSLALRMQKTSDRLLTKYDERTGSDKISLIRVAASIFNATTGESEPGVESNLPLVGVVTSFDKRLIDGKVIQLGDLQLKITSGVEPLLKDKVIIDEKRYSIIDISKSRYTNTTIMYSVHLRL